MVVNGVVILIIDLQKMELLVIYKQYTVLMAKLNVLGLFKISMHKESHLKFLKQIMPM